MHHHAPVQAERKESAPDSADNYDSCGSGPPGASVRCNTSVPRRKMHRGGRQATAPALFWCTRRPARRVRVRGARVSGARGGR